MRGDRRKQKEIIDNILFFFFPSPLTDICSHTAFSLLFFDPVSSNFCPLGHQLSGGWRRAPPRFLSSLLSLFFFFTPFRIHTVLHPGNHLGTPGN